MEVIFDKNILLFENIGIDPNDNTATVWIHPPDLEAIIRDHGNNISYLETKSLSSD